MTTEEEEEREEREEKEEGEREEEEEEKEEEEEEQEVWPQQSEWMWVKCRFPPNNVDEPAVTQHKAEICVSLCCLLPSAALRR